jgi:Pyruvate/2-oxoacid:ferredoxin oxidoreductase gamma subunit
VARHTPPDTGRKEVVILGSAGQRIVTAGEIFCLAGMTAGLHASQKNDYPITVLQGHSVSELILSRVVIGYTGIEAPSVVIALAPEGVNRRRAVFARLREETLVIAAAGLDLPRCPARIVTVDFKAHKLRHNDWALAALAELARRHTVLSTPMLKAALEIRFQGKMLESALGVVEKMV